MGSVFRPEAIRRYHDSRERTVLPLFGKPRVMPAVWTCVGLLLVTLCVAAFTEVPVYVRGRAVPVGAPDAQGLVSSIALFPPESLPQLNIGQRAFVELSEGGGVGDGTVTNLIPRLLSPGEIDAQFTTPDGMPVPTEPVAVAVARFTKVPAAAPHRAADGSRAVWVEVGSKRLGSLIKIN